MKSLSSLGKSIIARVLGRSTAIVKGLVPVETLCENCRIKIKRSFFDPKAKRQSKWREMWILTLKNEEQIFYCSENCIVADLNEKENQNPKLIASNFRSEVCDNVTAAPLRGLFGELNWINTTRFNSSDFS